MLHLARWILTISHLTLLNAKQLNFLHLFSYKFDFTLEVALSLLNGLRKQELEVLQR